MVMADNIVERKIVLAMNGLVRWYRSAITKDVAAVGIAAMRTESDMSDNEKLNNIASPYKIRGAKISFVIVEKKEGVSEERVRDADERNIPRANSATGDALVPRSRVVSNRNENK
jgi:hypothetical protein